MGLGYVNGGATARAAAEQAAKDTGIQIVVAESKSADDVEAAYRQLVAQRVSAVIVGSATYFDVVREKHVALANTERMPTIYTGRNSVAAGGFISIRGDSSAGFRRCAVIRRPSCLGERRRSRELARCR